MGRLALVSLDYYFTCTYLSTSLLYTYEPSPDQPRSELDRRTPDTGLTFWCTSPVICKVPPRLRESSKRPFRRAHAIFVNQKRQQMFFMICRKIYSSLNHNFAVRRSLFDHPKCLIKYEILNRFHLFILLKSSF